MRKACHWACAASFLWILSGTKGKAANRFSVFCAFCGNQKSLWFDV